MFSYTVILHLLIFAVLMRWSHRHSTSIKDLVALCAKQVTLTLPLHLTQKGVTRALDWSSVTAHQGARRIEARLVCRQQCTFTCYTPACV